MMALWAIVCVMSLAHQDQRPVKGALFGCPIRNLYRESLEHHMAKRNAKKAARRRAAPQRAQQRQAPRARTATAPRRSRQAQVPTNVRVAAPTPLRNNNQDKLVTKLTGEDAALVNYMDSLTNWEALPAKVPILLGEFELETDLYEVKYTGSPVANASGFACVGFAPDNWASIANDGTPYEQFVGPVGAANQGYPVNYTIATFVGQASPNGAYATGQQFLPVPQLGPKISAYTRLRLTSAIMEVWSDAAVDTASGDITLAVVQNSTGITQAVLNGVPVSTVDGYDEDFVVTETFPLSNWSAGFKAHCHLTPWDEQCFGMERVPGNGNQTTTPLFAMTASAIGMAAGQKFKFEIKARYETTRAPSNETGGIDTGVPFLEPARVIKPLRPLRGKPPTIGLAGHGNGKGVNAAAIANPDILQGGGQSDFMDNLTKSAKKGLSWVASKIPYVGGLASKAVDWLFG